MTTYSVAVRPTKEEIKRHSLHYDEAYYEDRKKHIKAASEAEAVTKYIESDKAPTDRPDIGLRKGDHFFLTPAEIKYVRARPVSK